MRNTFALSAVFLPVLVTLFVAVLARVFQLLLAGGIASLALLAGFVFQRVVVVDVLQVGMIRPIANLRRYAAGLVAPGSRTGRRRAARPDGQRDQRDDDGYSGDLLQEISDLLPPLVAQPHTCSVGRDAIRRYAITCEFPDRDQTVAVGAVLTNSGKGDLS